MQNGRLPTDDDSQSSAFPLPPSAFRLAVCCLGLSAFLTQLTLMRELLSVLSGNELVFGIVLGSWMLLTGIGSAVGKTAGRLRWPLVVFVAAQILIALLPIADVFLLRSLRNVVFLRGAELGVTEAVVSCFVLLAPYCLTTGYVLTVASRIADEAPGGTGVGKVYLWDNLGNVLGGVAFVVVLVHLFDHFVILYFAAALNLLFAGIVAAGAGKRFLAAMAGVLLAALLGLAAFGDLNDVSRRLEYAAAGRVLFHGDSPYGSLVVTESAGQRNFIENGVPLFSTGNIAAIEETVHYAMAQRPNARRVLLISGGVSGTAREILKYPVEAVDYVELDPLILEVAQRYVPDSLADPRIHAINTDGRRFVRQTDRRYDVVIVDVPDPSTSQINRFYTQEFFAEVHRILTPGGVLSFSLGTYENYLGKELARLIGVTERTLRQVFAHVLMLPGGQVFFLASDGNLTADVAQRIETAGVKNRLVHRDYLMGMLTPDRTADLRRAVSAEGPVNEDFNPVLYYYHLRYWMSQFQVRFGILETALVVLLAIYVVRLRPVPLAVFCGGFAASALEVVLLMAFQILFGSLYYQVGVIVTMFMLGLVIGAALINRRLERVPLAACLPVQSGDFQNVARADKPPVAPTLTNSGQSISSRRLLALLAAAIAIFAACLPAVLMGLGTWQSPISLTVAGAAIPLLTLLLAVLVGMEFPLAARIDRRDAAATASRFYTADYVGAALGALLVSTWLIPMFGVTVVCLLTAGLNLLAAAVVCIANR